MAKWLVSARTKWWITGALIALVVALVPALYINSQCRTEGGDGPAAYHIAVEGEGGKASAAEHQDQSIIHLSFSDALIASETEKARAESTYYAPAKPFNWWTRFLCEINIADYVLAYFTVVLATSTIGLSYVTFQALRLGQDEYASTHRPHITVHFVALQPDQQTVRFRVVINGTGEAWVTGSVVMLEYMFSGEWPYPDDLVGPNIIGGTIAAPRRFGVGATAQYEFGNPALDRGTGRRSLYFMGWIVYQDRLGNSQTTYFCRVHKGSGQFGPADGTDYENT